MSNEDYYPESDSEDETVFTPSTKKPKIILCLDSFTDYKNDLDISDKI